MSEEGRANERRGKMVEARSKNAENMVKDSDWGIAEGMGSFVGWASH